MAMRMCRKRRRNESFCHFQATTKQDQPQDVSERPRIARIWSFTPSTALLFILSLCLSSAWSNPTRITGFGSSKPFPIDSSDQPLRLWQSTQTDTGFLLQTPNATYEIQPHCVVSTHAAPTTTASSVLVTPVAGLWGVVPVPSGHVWIFVCDSEAVYECRAAQIRRVKALHCVHVRSNPENVEKRQWKLFKAALASHQWYCGNATFPIPDLTRNWQSPAYDTRFHWNDAHRVPLSLMDCQIPVTSAFVGVQRVQLSPTQSYDQLLISRRSRFRAGTRFTTRGADATGAVANYVETEQIVVHRDRWASHVQTRGSIPLRWSSPTDIKTYRPRVRIGTNPVAQAKALQQHLLQESRYGDVLLVNLVDKKSDQGRLGRALDAVLTAVLDVYKQVPDPEFVVNATHLWFDFHAQVKKGRWDRLIDLLEDVSPVLAQGNYYSQEANGVVTRKQVGVVRTNCMDCLDRTNVVQSMFGRKMLFDQLKEWNLLSNEQIQAVEDNPMTLPFDEGEKAHRLLWADNADEISRLYAGTAALKRDFTRFGKRTKKGALDDGMNSLQRYYLNNFLDADRQEGLDLLTGFQGFSSSTEENIGADDDSADSESNDTSELSVKEAARQALLGFFPDETDNDDDSFVLLKPKKERAGLRWLPGDLRSHVHSVMKSATFSSLYQSSPMDRVITPQEALESVDARSASKVPWWVIAEDTPSPGEVSVFEVIGITDGTAALNNAGYLLGALAAGIQAPVLLAISVVGLSALALFPTPRQKEEVDEMETSATQS